MFQATDRDGSLLAAVLTRTDSKINLNYNGSDIRLLLHSLKGTPWALGVFYKKELLQAQLFHFATSGIWMLVLFVLAFVASVLLVFAVALAIQKIFLSVSPSAFTNSLLQSTHPALSGTPSLKNSSRHQFETLFAVSTPCRRYQQN